MVSLFLVVNCVLYIFRCFICLWSFTFVSFLWCGTSRSGGCWRTLRSAPKHPTQGFYINVTAIKLQIS